MYKKRDARAKLLFCQSKPIAFLPFALPSPSSLLELPKSEQIQGLIGILPKKKNHRTLGKVLGVKQGS